MKKSLALLACAAFLGLALAAGLGLSIHAAPLVRATPTPGVPSPQDVLAEPAEELSAERADLVVSSISVDGPARLGITTTIRVVVQNIGTADVASTNNFFVDLYVDPAAPPEAGRPGEPGTLTMGVQGYLFRVGQPVPLLFQYVFTRTRSYDLYARADTDGDVVEANEDNNVLGPEVANARTGTWVADVNHEDFQAGFSNMDTSHPLGLIALSGIYQEPVIAPNSIPYNTPLVGPTLYNPDFGVSSYAQAVNQVAPVIARNAAGHLYVAWEDGRFGEVNDRDIFFARSTDGGATWGPEVRVNRDPGEASQRSPSMVFVSSTNTIYIAWQDTRRGNYDIWLARSSDGGQTWFEPAGVPVNDDPDSAAQLSPSLTADAGGILYLVWQDRRNGNDDIYFAASADGGAHWTPNVLVTDQPASTAQAQRSPNVIATDDYLYVIWEDARSSSQGDAADIYYTWASRCPALCSSYTFDIDQRVNDDLGVLPQRDPTIARSTPRTEISRTEVFTPGTSLCASPPPITTEVLFRGIYEGQTVHFAWQDSRSGVDDPDIYHAWMFEPFFKLMWVTQLPNYNCALTQPFDPVIPNPFSDAWEILGNVPISRLDPETPGSCYQPPYGQRGLPCDPPLSADIPDDQPKRKWETSSSVQEMPAFSAGPPGTDLVYLLWSDRRNFDDWSARIYMAAPLRPIDSGEYLVTENIIVNDNPKLLRYLQGDRYLRNAPAAVRQYRPAGVYSNNTEAPFIVWDDDRRSEPLAGYALERNIFFARPGAPPSPGVFMSRIFEANDDTYWNLLEWWGVTPIGTRIFFQTRTGNTPWPDAAWSDWTGPFWDGSEGLWIYPAPSEIVGSGQQRYPKARYLQYRLWIKDYPSPGAPTWKPPFNPQRRPQAWVSKVMIHYSPKTYQVTLPMVVKEKSGPAPAATATPTGTRAPTATATLAAARVPNDTYYANYQWNMAKMRMPQAWGQTVGSTDLLVAVVDSGIDNGHPDLAGKVVGGYNFIDGTATIGDDNGHGTHVAGIVAAVSNNAMGVAGVAWNARLLSVKVLDSEGVGPLSAVANGIVWAADQNAKIINMSLGSTVGTMALQSAIVHAHNKGALLVASAGNSYADGNPIMYPAAYADVIGVGATGNADEHAGYSETGSFVDLTAPGGNPSGESDTNRQHWIWSTYARGAEGGNPAVGYMPIAGTSQAAPHVAGLGALLWSLEDDLSAAQVETIMRNTAVDLGVAGRDDVFGSGRIDAAAALQLADSDAWDAPAADSAQPAFAQAEIPADAEFVPGRVLVLFRETAGAPAREASLGAASATVEDQLPQIGWLVLRVPAGQERAVVARLRADASVRYAEPDYILRAH